MGSITIRNIDNSLKQLLRLRSAEHGCSMEEEVRNILRMALSTQSSSHGNLADIMHRRFSRIATLVPSKGRMRPAKSS